MKKIFLSLIKKLSFSFALIGLGLYLTGEIRPAVAGAEAARDLGKKFQKGVCYAAWEKDRYLSPYSDKSLENLKELGTNCLSIVTTWYQKNVQTPHISATEYTPSDESLRHAIKKSHDLGLAVMIKPHVDLIDTSDGQWRGDIFFYNEEDWDAWFEDYKEFITHYAKMSEETGVDILCIGTELSGTVEKTDKWQEIIQAIRKVYTGNITYAANWDGEYEKVGFWNDLDFAGVDAYFPMAKKEGPKFPELKTACDNWVKKLESWAKPLGKPIIFTEVGYSSSTCAPVAPWQEKAPGGADTAIQADCYKALFETVWEKEWLAGIYWWRWHANPDAGGPNNKGFTPQNKPAGKILAEWYRK